METMGLIQIIVMVCQVAQPDRCEEQHLQFAWQGTLEVLGATLHRPMDRRSSAMDREALSLRISGHAAKGLSRRTGLMPSSLATGRATEQPS
jgi:hypothetical protein